MSIWETIQAIILTVSAVILILEIVHLRKATALEGFNTLAELLNLEESLRARNLLYRNKGKVSSLPTEEIACIERIIVLWDQLGCLVNRKLIPERAAIEMYWDAIIKCWDASESWIRTERRRKRRAQTKFGKNQSIKKPRFSDPSYKKIKAMTRYTKSTGYKFYPKRKPEARDYPDTHYENFQMLVWRCERYCRKRHLDRPVIY